MRSLPGSRVPIPCWQSLALHEWETDKKRLWNPFTKKMEKERGTERKDIPLPPRFKPQSPAALRWQQFEASIIYSSAPWHPYTSQLYHSAHHGQDVCLILMSHTHTRTHTHARTHTRTHTHTHAHTHTHTHTHTHAHAHAHTHTRTRTHTHTHSWRCEDKISCVHMTVSNYYRRYKQNSSQWNNTTYTWVTFYQNGK